MSWVKAIDKYSDSVQLCRVVGSEKQFPAMFAPHVICDFTGKTYKKEDIEWFDISQPSFGLLDMQKAYKAGQIYGFEKCGSGITSESFDKFIKLDYNMDITNG